jgi:Tol biopolymer transport system component
VSDDVPKWSRDGRTIVFARRLTPVNIAGSASRAAQLEVWVAYSDGSNARRLVGTLEDPGIPAVGPIDFGAAFDFQP